MTDKEKQLTKEYNNCWFWEVNKKDRLMDGICEEISNNYNRVMSDLNKKLHGPIPPCVIYRNQ